MKYWFKLPFVFPFLSALVVCPVLADGLPEPGLVMYGVVRNAAAGNARLTTGTITWTVKPASGTPLTLTAPLTDIGSQYSYMLRVPFESIVGSATPSGTAFVLNSAATSYIRTNVTVTIGSNTFSAAIQSPALGNFTFSGADRGKTEQVDLSISAAMLISGTNGIPDAWQMAHFGRVGIDPGADPDQDGANNYQEYVAGTDPNDASSVFKFTNVRLVTSSVTELKWLSSSNRVYSVFKSAGLSTGAMSFSMIGTNILSTPPFNTLRITNNPTQGPYFYRLQVVMP